MSKINDPYRVTIQFQASTKKELLGAILSAHKKLKRQGIPDLGYPTTIDSEKHRAVIWREQSRHI